MRLEIYQPCRRPGTCNGKLALILQLTSRHTFVTPLSNDDEKTHWPINLSSIDRLFCTFVCPIFVLGSFRLAALKSKQMPSDYISLMRANETFACNKTKPLARAMEFLHRLNHYKSLVGRRLIPISGTRCACKLSLVIP